MGERLGQHFLKNKSVIPKMIAALELKSGEAVVEIGPGEGALTLPLAEECKKAGCRLIAIERDAELVGKLKNLQVDGLEIVEGDALEIIPEITKSYSLNTISYKIVGNIPYYITGHLLRVIEELQNRPAISVLMIQKEVAERAIAKPPKMNLLAAATQVWADPKIIARLKPKDFDPPPKVDSAVIELVNKERQTENKGDLERYYRTIKLIFKQPRKTLLNNLANGLEIDKNQALELMKSIGLTGSERPQNLSLEQLIKLSTITAKYS